MVVVMLGLGIGRDCRSGDSNGGNPPAAIPFSKIINNTIYGGDSNGILLSGASSGGTVSLSPSYAAEASA